MSAENIRNEIYLTGLSPVVVLDDANDAVPLAKALLAGGINVMEITFRTAAAEESIRRVAEQVPEMIVGAGTCINAGLAQTAVEAGAQFIVTPGYSHEVVCWCHEHDVCVVPGTSTVTDIMAAVNDGCDVVKLFPAELAGGLKLIGAVASVFPNLKFMPSGGIDFDNFSPYAKSPKIFATTGSWMAPKQLIREKKFAEITEIARKTVLASHDFKLLHIGINNKNIEDAFRAARGLSDLLDEPLRELASAYFVGDMADVVKYELPCEHGHIAIAVNNIERAVHYFEHRGYSFTDMNYDDKGNLVASWFDPEKYNFGGFAVHLRAR